MSEPITSQPSLRALSFALRHPETWPEGFEFNFIECDKCAMGLANRMWSLNIDMGQHYPSVDIAPLLGISCQTAKKLFVYGNTTREGIADAIDAYLESIDV